MTVSRRAGAATNSKAALTWESRSGRSVAHVVSLRRSLVGDEVMKVLTGTITDPSKEPVVHYFKSDTALPLCGQTPCTEWCWRQTWDPATCKKCLRMGDQHRVEYVELFDGA